MRLAAAEAAESGFLQTELGFVLLLTIAAIVAIVIRRVRLPYTVALVLVGLVLALFPDFLGFEVGHDLILFLLVPPLIFEAATHLSWERLRADLAPVLLLAVVGTFAGTALVTAIVVPTLGLPVALAVVFGALISATDPVAVIAFFRSLGVSKRLTVLVEGESLFNDGVAIVVFSLALSLVAALAEGGAPPSLTEALLRFLTVAFGGLAVGIVLGYVVSHIVLKNLDDHLIETTVTLALAFGAFAIAEQFHWSGILAVVAAGLFVGNVGFRNTSPTTKLSIDRFWEFLAFVANSLVFLLIGLRIEILDFGRYVLPVLVAVAAVLVSRAVVVYSLTWVHAALGARRPVPLAYRHVMFWGGLRGAISLALVLTLSGAEGVPDGLAEEIQIMTFGVVLFTLLVQGTTIERLLRRLGLADKPAQRLEQQRRQARVFASRAARQELAELREEGMLAEDIWQAMDEVSAQELAEREEALRGHLEAHPELEQEMILQARADALRAERTAITSARQRGLISDEVQAELSRDVDDRAAGLAIIDENRDLGHRQDGPALDADSSPPESEGADGR